MKEKKRKKRCNNYKARRGQAEEEKVGRVCNGGIQDQEQVTPPQSSFDFANG